MKSPVLYPVTLLISLMILLPALANADPADEIRMNIRSRMLRRAAPEAPAAPSSGMPTRPAPVPATAAGSSDSSDDPTYGFAKENPIKMGGEDLAEAINGAKYYLRQLRDQHNKPFTVERLGNVGFGTDGHITDLYKLTDSNGVEQRLYLDLYHPDIHPKEAKAPKGMGKAR